MLIVKTGGGAGINWDAIAKDLCTLSEPCVIVHGANALMKEVSLKMGVTERTILSPSGHTSRYTDPQALDLLTMVYAGLANKRIVAVLARHGIPAIGLSGADGRLFLGKRKEVILSMEGSKVKMIRDSATGKIESVNVSLLRLLLDAGYLPVLTVPAITDKGELINVDTDRVVAVLARELGAEKVVMLFEAPGLLQDLNREDSRCPTLNEQELEIFLRQTQGRMKKKLLAVQEALSFGVREVFLGDGRTEQPLTRSLRGEGTVIRKDV